MEARVVTITALATVGAENPVMSCELPILVDEATEPVAS
jgi:hypothetical protein